MEVRARNFRLLHMMQMEVEAEALMRYFFPQPCPFIIVRIGGHNLSVLFDCVRFLTLPFKTPLNYYQLTLDLSSNFGRVVGFGFRLILGWVTFGSGQ